MSHHTTQYHELNSDSCSIPISHSHSYQTPSMYPLTNWRSALRAQPTYRIGNRTLRFNYHFALVLASVGALLVFFLFWSNNGSSSSAANNGVWLKNYVSSSSSGRSPISISQIPDGGGVNGVIYTYNATYPITPPLVGRGGIVTYRIAMVADLDTNSKLVKDDGSTVWRSYLKKGHLSFSTANNEIKINWDDSEPIALESSFALKNRGMELSELVTFDGRLLTFDDRTGLVYEIVKDRVIPWVILLDGNGHSTKGFKSEWATVKHHTLFVGSMGKEWTTSMGDFENENPMYVKMIAPTGEVRSLDWSAKYKVMRDKSLQIIWPGYMIHESGVWSPTHQKWFFLPRRCSKEKYNETRDEYNGCNILIAIDENFEHIDTVPLGATNTTPTHGFSSFKFIPDTNVIVALKSEELNGKTTTFITAFDITGKTLLPEQKINTEFKYEGFEFI